MRLLCNCANCVRYFLYDVIDENQLVGFRPPQKPASSPVLLVICSRVLFLSNRASLEFGWRLSRLGEEASSKTTVYGHFLKQHSSGKLLNYANSLGLGVPSALCMHLTWLARVGVDAILMQAYSHVLKQFAHSCLFMSLY